jgi:hypothetical protein
MNMAKITDAPGQDQGGQVWRIDPPKSSYEILPPFRLSVFDRVGIMDAKSAYEEKKQNCVPEKRGGDG